MTVEYPALEISDYEDMFLTRLAICYKEIKGIKTVFETPPATTVDVGALPLVYTLVGPMGSAIPNASSGHINLSRIYTARLYVHPFTTGTDSGAQGSRAQVLARPFYARFRDYFMKHWQLDTEGLFVTALPNIGSITLLTLVDGGLEPMPGPGNGGGIYSAIDFDLSITVNAGRTGLS